MKNMIRFVFVFLLVFAFCIPTVAQAEQRAMDCFEWDADGEECQEQTMVLGSQADVSAFQTLLAKKTGTTTKSPPFWIPCRLIILNRT